MQIFAGGKAARKGGTVLIMKTDNNIAEEHKLIINGTLHIAKTPVKTQLRSRQKSIKSVQEVRSMKVANQKLITIMPSEKEIPYHTFTEKELCTACDLLRDSGVALTIYLVYASQKENYTILTGVNQLKLRGIHGISSTGYSAAMKKLTECGYITPGEEKDHFLFWRIPQKIEAR